MTDDDDNIDDLISQLQEVNSAPASCEKESVSLDKVNMEQFVIDSAGELITKSLHAVDDIKQYVLSAPDSEQIDSLASLIRASANAIDTLNKIVLQDKKSDTSRELKAMDFEQKKALQSSQANEMSALLKMSREEMVQNLLKDSTLIDAEVTDVTNDSVDDQGPTQ
jgi:hypothetical protein